jgi:hypothetical protein
VVCAALLAAACADPESDRVRKTTVPTYDEKTGKLTQLTYDRDKDGVIDTWTDMDGRRALRSRIDLDEDGRIDRWEYYDETGALLKVGFSRKKDGKVDAWAYSAPDGKPARIDISSTGDESKIDRREFYDKGVLARVEEDSDDDGRVDTWETYQSGALATTSTDENADGVADRRLTYAGGTLVLIESDPDASGTFRKRVEVK